VIGQPDERKQTMRALEHAMPFVRRELGGRIRIRRIPELLIRSDDSAQRGTRVLQLLAELEAGGSPDDVPAIEESLPTPAPRFGVEASEEPAMEPVTARTRGARRRPAGKAGQKPRGRR
jgi:hypothetical protein